MEAVSYPRSGSRSIASILCVFVLTACGGGGSSTDPVAPKSTNAVPTDITLSNSSVDENVTGAEIGTL